MDLSVFFQPVENYLVSFVKNLPHDRWGKHIYAYGAHFPDWQQADILIIGSTEERGAPENGLAEGPDAVREKIYQLSLPVEEAKVADLGNLKPKESPEAYYEVLGYVLGHLIQAEKSVIILGGSQDIAYGQYMAYEEAGKHIEYVCVDGRFDVEDADIQLNNRSYNHKIFSHKPDYLFNFTNLGYQSYFVSDHQRQVLNEMNFFSIRYGDLYGNIQEAEPHLRTADMVSIDMSSVRHHEAPGATSASPGGFSAMEICRIARYAGLGYGVSSMSICEYIPESDPSGQTAQLVAMMCWYFTEGYYSRRDDFPGEDRSNLRKYAVRLHASIEEINFYQHPSTGRWWMEVPFQQSLGQKLKQTRLVACSKSDYEFARGDDIPERWWLTYNKLH